MQTLAKERYKIRAIIMLVLVLLNVVSAKGQSSDSKSDPEKTEGGLNGPFWKKRDDAGKVWFLIGYIEALNTTAVLGLRPERGAAQKAEINAKTESLSPYKLTIGETKSALDKFYETPENGPIPIWNAVSTICLRANGLDEASIQKLIVNLRTAVH